MPQPPWPDLIIACGGRTAAPVLAMKRASRGKTAVVFLQDPRTAPSRFDLVIAPVHDGVQGPNVITLDTALHAMTGERLEAAAHAWGGRRLASLPAPRLGVLLGGRSRAHRFTPDTLAAVIGGVNDHIARTGGSALITPSPRTEAWVVDRLKAAFADTPSVFLHDGTGDNPYPAILALSDALTVTEDSVTMISEALSTGKTVTTLALAGHGRRHGLFLENLRAKGYALPFTPQTALAPPPPPLENPMEKAVNAVRAMMAQR